jgi:type I restriction enzyme S subunit
MNPQQLLQHFDRISEAPDAIPRLRRFILDLAVRGKLVEQEPNDEPASELLKHIQTYKAGHAISRKTKAEKPLPASPIDVAPFEVPASWIWLRLDELAAKITDGEHLSPAKTQDGMMLLTAKHILDGGVSVNDPQYVSYQDGLRFRERCDPQNGDILICSRGTIGRCCVMTLNEIFCLMGSVILLRPFPELTSRYLDYFIKSDEGQLFIRGVTKGMAVNALYLKDIRLCPIPLPPFAEQHRIVAKVDELMALCDQLQAAQSEREQSRDRLVVASLQSLNPPTDDEAANAPETLREPARFLFNHLPRLTTRPAHIKQLRQTILNLAVRGKLVPQDPNDEPIKSVILRREGNQQIQLSNKSLDSTNALGNKFVLPVGWDWLTGQQVANFVDPQPSHRTPPEIQNGVPYIGYGDISLTHGIDFGNARKVSPEVLKDHQIRYTLKEGDFVIGKIGTIGQPFSLPSPFEYTLSANLILVQPYPEFIIPRYLVTFFASPIAESALQDNKTDSTHAVFGIKKARLLLIPSPPLAEQNRIVAKVDELMALCDQLETQLTSTATNSRRLLEAVLHEALLPATEQAA